MLAVELLPERRCSTCQPAQKAQWGCTEDAQLPTEMDGVALTRCPRRPLLDDPDFYSEVFWLYQAYQKGFLPEEGGLQDQATVLISSFQVIDAAMSAAEAERERIRKSREAMEKRARGMAAKGRV